MRVKIEQDGKLVVTAETSIESYALDSWSKSFFKKVKMDNSSPEALAVEFFFKSDQHKDTENMSFKYDDEGKSNIDIS